MPILPQENLPTLSVKSVLDKYSMLDDGIAKFNHIIDNQEYGVLKHVMNDMSKKARKRPLSDLAGGHEPRTISSHLSTPTSTNRSSSKNTSPNTPTHVNSRSKSPDIRKKKKTTHQRISDPESSPLSRQFKSPKNEIELKDLINGLQSSPSESTKRRKPTTLSPSRRPQRGLNDSNEEPSSVSNSATNNRRSSVVKVVKKPISKSKHVSFHVGSSTSRSSFETQDDGILRPSGPVSIFEPNFGLERPGSSDSGGSGDETLPGFVSLKVPKYEEKLAEDISNVKNKKSNTQNNAYNEVYDRAPIGAMRVSHQFPTKREKFLRESTSKWFVRWTAAVQVPNSKKKGSNLLYTSPFEKTFRPSGVPRKFKLPDALITIPRGKGASNGNQRNETSRPISYEMDEMDQLWIDSENFKRINTGADLIHPSDFLKIMNTLEADAYLNTTKVLLEQVGSSRCFFDDPNSVACDICYMPECESDDNIVFCDGCETVVHQSCYGLNEVPSGSWLCDVCLMESTKPKCLMCPLPHGAMKKTSCGSGYIHIACALWIEDVTFEDASRREGIKIYAKKKSKKEHDVCQVCNIFEGAHLFCSKNGCNSNYHVTCAQRAGYRFQMDPDADDNVKFISYCRKHTMETLPKDTTVTNKFVRSRPSLTAEDLEKTIMLYTEAETNPVLKDIVDDDIITDVFEYWKLKRFDKGGPLISPAVISVNYLPVFKEIVTKSNHVRLRSEPFETRMATDKARTLMWMVQDRENKKLEILNKIKDQTFEIMDKCTNEDELENAIESLKDFVVGRTSDCGESSKSWIEYSMDDNKGPELDFDIESYIEKKIRIPKKVKNPLPRIQEVNPDEIERFDFKNGEKKDESIQYELDEREFESFTDKYGRIALNEKGEKNKNSDKINISELLDNDDNIEDYNSFDFTKITNIAIAKFDDNGNF